MFKNYKLKFVSTLASLLTIIAFSSINPYSFWIYYEPDVPSAIKDQGLK